MCGRTSLYVDPSVVEDRFAASFRFPYESRYNIAPRQSLATIPNTDPEAIVEQEWGLLADWADDPSEGPRPINARVETVTEKPMFEDAVTSRRCLVLADGFYEWAGDRGSKQPYRVHIADDDPFAMAGLWNRWTGDDTALETVTILTTDANEVVAPIHDRMPVVLERADERTWLTADTDAALGVCGPYRGDDLAAYRVSTAVNDPGNDRPDVILPAETTQRGLDDFGS